MKPQNEEASDSDQRRHGRWSCPARLPEARSLVADDTPDVVSLSVDIRSGDPSGSKLETATDGYEAPLMVEIVAITGDLDTTPTLLTAETRAGLPTSPDEARPAAGAVAATSP